MLPILPNWTPDKALENDVANCFFRVLRKRGLNSAFDPRELHIRERFTMEVSSSARLSNAVLDADFPRLGPTTVLHYTSRAALQNILSTGEIRLSPLSLRCDDGEFRTFAQRHSLTGYLKSRGSGPTLADEMMKDLFFLSGTLPGSGDENRLWRDFGDLGHGVRLHLRLSPVADGVLREVHYDVTSTLLKVLNDRLRKRTKRPFIPKQLSRIGGFYLPLGLKGEGEVRLLLKRFRDWEPEGGYPITGNDTSARWAISLGQASAWCRIDLGAIECGPQCDRTSVETLVRSSTFASTSVI